MSFTAAIDVPLALLLLLSFLAYAEWWSRNHDLDREIDLVGRLPLARVRLVSLFSAVLCICWWLDLAIWPLVGIVFFVGLVCSAFLGGPLGHSGGVFLLFAAFVIREWAFRFPTLVLQPPLENSNSHLGYSPLLGSAGVVATALRPSGKVDIDGRVWDAKAEDGAFVDIGKDITVTGFKNGMVQVRNSPA